MLRKPGISLIIKDIYIPKPTPESEATRKPETAVILNPNSNTVADTPPGATNPSSFPMVQPLRAALHFDSPEGFGEWKVMFPSSAHRDLRDAHRRNPKLFDIVVKKVKCVHIPVNFNTRLLTHSRELSKGHFSDDNQKKLNKAPSGIPIFEAKMTSDTRLVVGQHMSLLVSY